MTWHLARLGPALGLCLLLGVPVGGEAAPLSPAIKTDHFGYSPQATKVAVFSADPGASVELRDTSDRVVFTIPADGGSIVFMGDDGLPSGDTVWWVDFSPFTTLGTFRLLSPALGGQSVDFEIAEDVYSGALEAALKTFYYQRCNTPKEPAHAGDWADAAPCHMGDQTAAAAAGHGDRGRLDMRGGWHDAGDYNKYVWTDLSTAVLQLLRAYVDNPSVFADSDLDLPESGNGVPDILDEVRWELDWLLRMQLPDGSVLQQLHTDGWASDSPPSADANSRFYHDPTLESGAVLCGVCALASRVFEAEGQAAYAATLRAAAGDAWTWLLGQGDAQAKAWAAAELFRLDGTVTSARDYVDGFHPGDWAGVFLNVASHDTHAAVTYVQTPGATAAVVAHMRADIANQVDYIFDSDDLYRNGMPDWSYYWGSNAIRAQYGLFLLQAARLGETGSHTAGEAEAHALDFLHFFHGQNALNMLYLTNMAARGGEHSSYQLYHAWFGASGSTFSSDNYIGKPADVVEPDYPYFSGLDNHGISDDKSSRLGPAPGFVPGGPNASYSGDATPPGGATYLNRFYRDWNDQTVWTALTWEITENSIKYQGCYAALAAYFAPRVGSGCDTTALGPIDLLRGRKEAPGGVALSWTPDAAAPSYHLNAVVLKTELTDPRRPPGLGAAVCDVAAPLTICSDEDAFAAPEPLLFYQALSACGLSGAEEGPY